MVKVCSLKLTFEIRLELKDPTISSTYIWNLICSKCIVCLMQTTQYVCILLNKINCNKDT